MIYLIVGTILTLAGVGLMMNKDSLLSLLGIILFLVGISIALKGRRELDKFKGEKNNWR